MSRHADWYEFVCVHRIPLVDAYLRASLGLLGRSHVPERRVPKLLRFDDSGWLELPEGWTLLDLPSIDLRVLPRGQRHYTRAVHRVPLAGKRLGQQVFETTLMQMVPGRLPTPFVGKVSFELRAENRQLWQRDFPAQVGWVWPLPLVAR
jgi:hypothetical protein